MKGSFVKYIALIMALILALSSLAFLPIAAEEEGVRGSEEYFVFSHLEDGNGVKYIPNGAQLSLPLSTASSFEASNLSLLAHERQNYLSNAFYISLSNNSNAAKICISYTYKSAGGTESEVVETALGTGKQILTLSAPHIGEQVEEIQISFAADTALSGSVELHAFCDISTYAQSNKEEATLSRCHYSKEENVLQIQGALSYAATVRYEGGTLAIFALSEGESLHLSGKTPITRTDISFQFSFVIPVSRNDELFKRYVVAAITSTGERVPLCTPIYPSLPAAPPAAAQGFKGYHSLDFLRVMDNVPDMGVVDVYLDRLFASQNNGILYAGEYDYYYFDQSYVAELERQAKNLTGVGANVYLRILVGNSRDNLSFADDAPVDVNNRLAVLRGESAQRDLYAVIDFLTGRFQDQTAVSGLILGRSADLVSKYSYCEGVSLAQYSAFYASTLNLVAGVARRNIPELRVLVPVSDRVWPQSVTSLQESSDFFRELFLPSLMQALETQILEPQSFGLMLENTVLSDRLGGNDPSHIGVDRLPTFLADLEKLSGSHTYLDANVFFSWIPVATAETAVLHADYLLKYITLSQNSRIFAFLLDLSELEREGGEELAQSMDYLARYINTDRLADASRLALSVLGVQSLGALYSESGKLVKKNIYRADLVVGDPASASHIKGSASLWNFATAEDTQGWYEGSECQSFFLSSVNQADHTLVAKIASGANYGEIAYHFASPVDVSFATLFSMPVSVVGSAGTRYEIQLRFIGERNITYASAVVEAGKNIRLCLDLSAYSGATSDLRAVRLMARPLDGDMGEFELHFGGMDVHSATLSDKELSECVGAIWLEDAQNRNDEPTRDYAVPLLATAIVVVFSITVCVLLIMDYKRKKKRNPKKS